MNSGPDPHIIIGLMSGTSLDGVDVALTRLVGTGQGIEIETIEHATFPYESALRAELLRVSSPEHSDVATIGRLNSSLAHVYADAVRSICRHSGVDISSVDAVGSHGQTIYHDPSAGYTLQIGDPSVLAQLLGVTVVGDFRQGDMALGGEGAPLVPYMDWSVFSSNSEHRALLNLGGIANISFLPAGCERDAVMAFDTGPANMILDSLAERFFNVSYDEGGERALSGVADEGVIQQLLQDPYFAQPPPKSTGRELYNASYVDSFLGLCAHLDHDSTMATAAELSVQSIFLAIEQFSSVAPQRLIVGGGGVHNRAIMKGLESGLSGVEVVTTAAHGVDPDAKEAICFAILAHEALSGVATGMPSVTGASGRAFLGKICFSGK